MKYLRKTIIGLLKIAGTFFTIIILYFLLALILTIIPANRNAKQPSTGIQIFVRTNGVHTDFVLPVNTVVMNWEEYIHPLDFKKVYHPNYITFGWGDKGFYLETPDWSDLKASTAFKALFFLSSTAMHVSYLKKTPLQDKDCISLIITENQYRLLIKYILDSFRNDKKGNIILIPDKGYDTNDNFYEAKGTYSFINTCNTWLNSGLKHIGVRSSLWAPFDKYVFYHLNEK
jgi:uncharacterized protein (TIGR02117 family)